MSMRRVFFSALLASAVLVSAPALAQTVHPIVFNNGEASVTEIDAKVGDTVAFYHMDEEEAHQLYSTDEAHQFDVKHIFETGDHFDIRLTSPGSFDVLCHAMPHMKITVNVAE
jgi:plastocyanin